MRAVLSVAFLIAWVGLAVAEPGILTRKKLLFADAASDACFSRCADQNASCKRVCPTTFSTPCLSGCDTQAQTCRQSCQNR